jgi:hypothetical protein
MIHNHRKFNEKLQKQALLAQMKNRFQTTLPYRRHFYDYV